VAVDSSLDTVPNIVSRDDPIAVNAAIRLYSIAVTPLSSNKSSRKILIMKISPS
jgi:hypothetical protein